MHKIPDNKYNTFIMVLSVSSFIIAISLGIFQIIEFGESAYINIIKYNNGINFYDITTLCSFFICIATTFIATYHFIKHKGKTILLMTGLIILHLLLIIFNLLAFFASMSGASLGNT